ncbi:MAG: PEPxxWA-CTERM sorting domain-containing protein [Patescibacteria group bacterium]
MKRFSCVAAAIAALCLSATAANAANRVTFEGIIDRGVDADEIFGKGLDLDGLSFTASYVFDADLGVRVTEPGSDTLTTGVTSPFTTVRFTIGGVTRYLDMIAGGTSITGTTITFNAFPDPDDALTMHMTSAAIPPLLTTPFGRTAGSGSGNVEFPNGYGYFSTYYVTNESLSAIPEPATWAMMIVGFGLAGSALRRSRNIPVAA